MKVLLVILHADVARGGAERYTMDLACALRDLGHAVSLGARTFANMPPGIQQVHLDGGGVTRVAQYHRFLGALSDHQADHSYDVVHAMLPVRRCDIYHPHAGVAVAATGGRWSYNPRRRAMADMERKLLAAESPPVVLCLSLVIKQVIRQHYAMMEDRLAMLFNAVDLARFDPSAHAAAGRAIRDRFAISCDAPLAAMIAQDFHRKGLEQTLRAMAAIKNEGGDPPYLLVAGRPDPGPFQRMAEKLAVKDRVVFLGPVPDPRPIYAAADMLVLPTRHDPCSLVVLEALAMGLPVITTRCNGASEIMTDGVHGFVLDDPDDVPALSNTMRRLADAATRQKMHQACLTLRPQLAYEQHLQRLLEIYRQCAALPSGPLRP